ncbi:hypothetical protein [Nostoc sp. UHCC 0870]|uniref:hypothetical protein n=1 Tax=Nostoc sp. UHCC 0870 TaxID=2914041 RepID=UPI001EE0281E|nr:hypothetical protein [Nostoc sp. UHCC 0870]UKP01033.1 hypothetical protein L6494_28200 [Nostoc sp. UHCC 0870]UKP01204.1 hypothetical protein L6494_29110 [Nostoc sp. UHCC 0870]
MYQPQELFNNLSPEEISRTLRLSEMVEKETYTEDEAERFRQCRSFIEQGGTDEEVMSLLPPIVSVTTTQDKGASDTKNGKKSRKKAQLPLEPLDITELLIAAREQGFKLTLTHALNILAFCGLGEKDEYSPQEAEHFLAACNLVSQGKTEQEIAAHFGVGELDNNVDIQLTIEETELLIEQGGDQLFGEMLRDKAEKHAAVAPALYLKYLSEELATDSSRQGWRNLLEMIKARAVGKPRPQFTSKVQVLQPSMHLNSLPANSENGLTSD